MVRTLRHNLNGRPKVVGKADWGLLCAKLQGQSLAVVVNHDIGGGASVFCDMYISKRRAESETVLLLSYHIFSNKYFVQVFDELSPQRYAIDSLESFFSLASQGNVQRILYNSAVSFPQPLAVVDMLAMLKENTDCELIIVLHDHFAICPSQFLLNSGDKYCGVPDVSVCKDCLQQHKYDFIALSNSRDINHWRSSWSKFLKVADEVRIFSESSRQLLKKAYPFHNNKNWTVKPHVLHTPMHNVELHAGSHLHIGVVGAIVMHKGANIVRDLAAEIIRRRSDAKITIIGTMDSRVPDEIVTVTGHYEPEQLAEIIKNSEVNIFLFPSIVPETFSYVAHELVAMGVPLACFNMGAPAELVRTYKNGLALGSMEAGAILTELEKFRRKIYQISDD